jgi:hypothetical protein
MGYRQIFLKQLSKQLWSLGKEYILVQGKKTLNGNWKLVLKIHKTMNKPIDKKTHTIIDFGSTDFCPEITQNEQCSRKHLYLDKNRFEY